MQTVFLILGSLFFISKLYSEEGFELRKAFIKVRLFFKPIKFKYGYKFFRNKHQYYVDHIHEELSIFETKYTCYLCPVVSNNQQPSINLPSFDVPTYLLLKESEIPEPSSLDKLLE